MLDHNHPETAWEPDYDLLRDLLLERELDREIERQAALSQQSRLRQTNGGTAPLEASQAPPVPDRDQLETFVRVLFKHATVGKWISLRAFFEGRPDLKPFEIVPVKLNGKFDGLIDQAYRMAELAAHHHEKVVFCPPIATFNHNWRARERDLAEGLVLSTECDKTAPAARAKLEAVLGPATLVVESGGEWTNPETGEAEPKLHVHHRLKVPTRAEGEHSMLKEARRLAAMLVGADTSNVPLVHPIRWPGSLHRKKEPKLCRIVACNPDAEIEIAVALECLRAAVEAEGLTPGGRAPRPAKGNAGKAKVGPNKVAEAFAHLDPNKNLGEGIKDYWFDQLTGEQKDEVVDHALEVIVAFLEKSGGHTNDQWYRLTTAVARSGAPNAEDIFVKHALSTKNPEPEDFLRKHFARCQGDPRPEYGGITVGTLLGLAMEHGADFEKWRRLVPDSPILPPEKRPPLKGGMYSRAEALELLNSHFFIGRRDQEPVEIYRINDDGSLTLYPQKAFSLEAGNIFVPGQEKPIQASTWWPKQRQRHQRRIVFKPHGTNDPSEYNLWLGFGVEPHEGKEKSRSLLQHIFKVICRGNREHFQYLTRWMAWKVQNPDKHPETVVVLKSKYQGTGKSLLGDVMSLIFGKHALLVDSQDQIFGSFTEHLELICFAQMEEILFAGDHKTTDRVKSFITGRTISIHCKFGPRFPIPNRIASMLFTNHEHAVALGARDRRFFVLDVATQYAGNLAYFKRLWADISDGGVNEFLYQLLNMPLGAWHPREMIKTQEATEQQRMSADPISQWAQECIDDDRINTGRGTYGTISYDLGTRVETKDLYDSCVFSCRRRGVRPPDLIGFGKACAEMFGPRQHVEDGKRRPYGYNVPTREIWQGKLNERLGIPTPDDVAEPPKRPNP